MSRNVLERGASRRAQEGSFGPLVILIVIAALVWWQWDRISAFFGTGGSLGGGSVTVEIVDYRCQPQASGRLAIDGRVRNTSNEPLALRAVTAVYDSSDKRSDYDEAAVRPSPLQPGQDGTFETEGAPLPDGGSCKLDGIVGSEDGHPVHITRARR